MAFSTAAEVRACNDKLAREADVSDTVIEDRIAEADDTIYVDLSGIATEAELTALGATNKVLNLLSTWKSVELCLARLFGDARQADQVSDVSYWKAKYNDLLNRVISGDISLSATTSPVATPVITSSTYRKKLFPTKGIADFDEGSIDDEF